MTRDPRYDIIYVYAAHGYLPAQLLSPVENRRTDEYGGSFENRARLIRELLEDTKEAVGNTCGVAFRFAVDNLDRDVGITHDGDGHSVPMRRARHDRTGRLRRAPLRARIGRQ